MNSPVEKRFCGHRVLQYRALICRRAIAAGGDLNICQTSKELIGDAHTSPAIYLACRLSRVTFPATRTSENKLKFANLGLVKTRALFMSRRGQNEPSI